MSNIIVKVKAALEERGYSGLFYPGECACELGDLGPCGEREQECGEQFINGCEPGYKFTDPKDASFWVVSRKNESPTEEEWETYRNLG